MEASAQGRRRITKDREKTFFWVISQHLEHSFLDDSIAKIKAKIHTQIDLQREGCRNIPVEAFIEKKKKRRTRSSLLVHATLFSQVFTNDFVVLVAASAPALFSTSQPPNCSTTSPSFITSRCCCGFLPNGQKSILSLWRPHRRAPD